MAFLQLDLPDDTYKRVLTRLHDLIIPAVFNPLLLSDFLTHSLDRGALACQYNIAGVAAGPGVRRVPWCALLQLPIAARVGFPSYAGCSWRLDSHLKLPRRRSLAATATPAGGLLGVLALNGIFVLVTRHGLEYPHFYARLYALLTPEVFQVRMACRVGSVRWG